MHRRKENREVRCNEYPAKICLSQQGLFAQQNAAWLLPEALQLSREGD